MLLELSIADLALIERASLTFGSAPQQSPAIVLIATITCLNKYTG